MADIDEVRSFLADEHGLATVSTVQADGNILSSIVNCGVVDHPATGEPSVALVATGSAARLRHIRRGSPVTVAIRRGWTWRSVSGPATIVGPDDDAGLTADDIRRLIRAVYQAAGGEHDGDDEFDRVMLADRRAAVFVTPEHIRGNG